MLEPRLPSTGTPRIVLLHLQEQGRQTSHILCLLAAWYSQLSEKAEGSLRKHPLLLTFRRWERFARNVLSGEERGETVVFSHSRPRGIRHKLHNGTPFYKETAANVIAESYSYSKMAAEEVSYVNLFVDSCFQLCHSFFVVSKVV